MPKGKGPRPPAAGEITAFGVDRIKQYPGPEQVELSVLVDVPGSWFGGALTSGERRERSTSSEFARLRRLLYRHLQLRWRTNKGPCLRWGTWHRWRLRRARAYSWMSGRQTSC